MKYLFYTHILFVGIIVLSLSACKDDWREELPWAQRVEEGISGELDLSLLPGNFSEHKISTRGTVLTTEQHVHSAYVFVIDMNESEKGPGHCKILSRRYFYDMTSSVQEVQEGSETFHVNELNIPTLSCNKAAIFAIINLGYSNVQGVANDKELLAQCDTLTSLQSLKRLSASLYTTFDKESGNGVKEVNVERMQGHHLMSGFLSTVEKHDYTLGSQCLFVLEADGNGKIKIKDFFTGKACRPLGSSEQGEPVAIFAHRLDAKITVNIEPDGELKKIPGAYFQLKSWQIVNIPVSENIFWEGERMSANEYAVSKLFKRDITPTSTKGWTFSYYQFENFNIDKLNANESFDEIDLKTIADVYNEKYNLKGGESVKPSDISSAFYDGERVVYPNKFTTFAYTLREEENKRKEDGTEYVPNVPDNNDQEIFVENVNYKYAPKNSSYLVLTGKYYNPQEPVKRRKDRDSHPDISFDTHPYLNEMQQPVRTKEEAAKRARSATVVYRVHLGYVGGGNYDMNAEPVKQEIVDFDDFKKKLNDYNVLRNHHYIYTIKVAGVENIKLEATRENKGNILEQEKQPGAEGLVVESQHLYELDSHYETRNLVIDFARMPENYDDGFSFGLLTPYEKMRITMHIKENGEVGFVDKDGVEVEGIRGHDLDWVHFAWHGTPNRPGRSLIDENGNGILYSQTHGGYTDQQSYLDKNGQLTHDKDEDHPYQLLNVSEFSKLVWTYFVKWKKSGRPADMQKLYFTFYVDEFYYDFDPVTKARTDWTKFCNQPRRELLLFMEKEEFSADNESWYADAHVVIYQKSIQTLYAVNANRGQVVPQVAFGIEGIDEFRAKYNCRRYEEHYFAGNTLDNGLYNTMQWYNSGQHVIPWSEAQGYYSEKARSRELDNSNFVANSTTEGRNNRRGQWAVYARNRDLNRNNRLDADEVRWFIPAVDQYTLCFLGGSPVFENPLFEREKSIVLKSGMSGEDWIKGIPLAHYMSSSNNEHARIFWAEEGCSKGRYDAAGKEVVYGIRMARMLTQFGNTSTGLAFENTSDSKILMQDPIYIVSRTKDGSPVPYEERVNGYNYYIILNKINVDAFRDYVDVGELGHHTHEQKQNWLYREFVVAKHKIGYKSYRNSLDNNPYPHIDGIPRTWWQMAGVWTDGPEGISDDLVDVYRYHGPEHTLAYNYYEDPIGADLHHWRVPNLREAAILSMSFPEEWFGGKNGSIISLTKSDNLGPQSTNIPYWNIKSNFIKRISKDRTGNDNVEPVFFYMRAIHDIR